MNWQQTSLWTNRESARNRRDPAIIGMAALLSLMLLVSTEASATDFLKWDPLTPLPDVEGFAAPFAGTHNGALIVAGGANFPESKPWDGGSKVWYDSAFVLKRPDGKWQTVARLPRPIAYGVSVTTDRGIACLGGSDSARHYASCFLMRWEDGQLKTTSLPNLPRPCANSAGVLLGTTIYVVGGIETSNATSAMHTFWSLDLSEPRASWKSLKAWPGPGRMLATVGAQGGSLYVFSGAALTADADGKAQREWLRDAYRFTPGSGWTRISDLPRPAVAAPTPAPALGQAHLLILGGDDGSQVTTAPDQHRGFPRDVLAYHTITDTWAPLGELPFSLVTTPTVHWEDRIVVPGGEARPGIRSNEVWSAQPIRRQAAFGWANFATLLLYPVGMLSIAWACSRRNKNTEDYFKASERIPWWAAGISIYATMLSSLTFMAVPAKAYTSDWCFFLNYVTIIFIAPVIIHLYLPFFRRLDVTSAYEYLERRFNLFIRLFGSASFIAFQIGRTGIVLFLPALALSTVSNIDMTWCIVGMTLLSIALTVFGGMEAVIWTDVAQTVILLGAVIASLVVLVLRFDGDISGMVHTAHAQAKFFENVNWSPDLVITTGWVALIGMGFNNFISYTSNQEVVQRYLTTQDVRQAARAIWTNALLSVPSGILFFAVGTALFVFYRQYPGRLDPSIQNDAIFPLFMLQELPAGVAGFVVAGIFAAAQPTSGLNSTAAAVVTDFYRRFKRSTSDHEALIAGRVATAVTGLLGMSVALIAVEMNIRSIWEVFLNVLGLTTGALAGVFALGILTRRANANGATCGLLAGAAIVFCVSMYTPLNPLLYGAVGVISTFSFGYLFSLFFPPQPAGGLTIYSLDQSVTS